MTTDMLLVNTSSICDNAGPAMYECSDCGLDIETACECIWEDGAAYVDVYCHGCQDYHKDIEIDALLDLDGWEDEDEDMHITPAVQNLLDKFNRASTGIETEPDMAIRYTSKCRHYNVPLTMKDGTTIYASSAHDRKTDEIAPDFGLYLDSMWRPSCLAYVIEWPDFGIPTYWQKAAEAIIDTFNKASDGLWVEVGCIGGHGRTGTALACMAVLGGMTSFEAVKFVREAYCEHAIESTDQEWFVNWFDVFVNGGVSLPMRLWDKKTKQYENGPTFSYTGPLNTEDYDPFAQAKGEPPAGLSQTVHNEYYTVPVFDDKKNKWGRGTVRPGDKEWDRAEREFSEQEYRKEVAEAAKKAAADAEVDKFNEYEPF